MATAKKKQTRTRQENKRDRGHLRRTEARCEGGTPPPTRRRDESPLYRFGACRKALVAADKE